MLNEAKHTDIIINTIGLPTELSNWITESFSDKFQLWFANNFKIEAIKRISGGKSVVGNIMLTMLKGDRTQPSLVNQLNRQRQYFSGLFTHIQNWLRGRHELAPETDNINLRDLSLDQAIARADAWQEAVQRLRTGIITDESGKIIKAYPDGFYWINLQKSHCGQEARAMGHCGTGSAGGILYSLRKSKNPYLTADVHRGYLIQLRGRANTKPKTEYHDKIMDFLLNDEVGIRSINSSTYKPEQNFELKDLDLAKLSTLYTAKNTLFVPDELYKILLKYPEFATQVNFKLTPLHLDHKESLIRRFPEMAELMKR